MGCPKNAIKLKRKHQIKRKRVPTGDTDSEKKRFFGREALHFLGVSGGGTLHGLLDHGPNARAPHVKACFGAARVRRSESEEGREWRREFGSGRRRRRRRDDDWGDRRVWSSHWHCCCVVFCFVCLNLKNGNGLMRVAEVGGDRRDERKRQNYQRRKKRSGLEWTEVPVTIFMF